MVKAALVGLLTALLAISSGNLAAAQSTSTLGTVAPAGSKVKTTPAVVPKATKATTTTTTGTKDTTTATTTAAAKTGTTAKTTTTTGGTTKATAAPAAKKKLDKAKAVRDPLADTTPDGDAATATTTTKKSLTKSKSTGTTATTADDVDTAATTTPKKSLKKSSSTNTRVVVRQQPSNGEPNWVGPRVNAPEEKACWRKARRFSTKCATGYAPDKLKTACWAECPLEYPIQCGMQCLPQSKDCTLAFIDKIAPLANAALSTATVGVFGSITKSVQGVAVALRCGKQLYEIVMKAVEYINDYEENKPETTKAALFAALKKSDIVAIDLPLGIATCLGLSVENAFSTAKDIAGPIKAITEKLVEKIVTMKNKALEPKQFVSIATTSGVKAVSSMKAADVAKLDQPVTCGDDLKGILGKVVTKVKELKEKAPTAPLDAIRLALSSTELVLVDIPKATKDCIPSGTTDFYEVRDQVRWSFQTMVDEVVNASTPSSASGEPLVKTFSKQDFAVKIAKMGLDILSTFDPTNFAALARAYIQKICTPTDYFGEIDDGKLKDALGLNIIGKAFETSNGAYMKKGDGLVKINFISSDTKDVDVNIYSAGKSIANVTLETDKMITWTKPMKELQDKTLYLDRWRPGLFTLPDKGGGSLVMWIPHSPQGGHVELHAVLNKS